MFAGLKRRAYTVRYPRWMVGKPLLYSSSALASLGDAMFGYSQGIIAAAQVQPSFIRRMYGKDITLEQVQMGQDGVDVFMQGIFHCHFLSLGKTNAPSFLNSIKPSLSHVSTSLLSLLLTFRPTFATI